MLPLRGSARVGIVLILLAALSLARADWVLPGGYHIEEIAREPQIVDPVAMDWNSDGELLVLEAAGRIKVIGKETVVAGHLSGAAGFAVRGNDLFVARPPELWLLRGTNRQVVLTHLPQVGSRGDINSLRFGRDGWLYFAIGSHDESEFYRFGIRAGGAQLLSSGVGRFHPESKRVEMVADGMVFPRGLAFDRAGELFAGDASRNHVFHVFPGVTYQRPLERDYVGYKPAALAAIADHRFLEGEFFGMTVYRDMVLVADLRRKALHTERLEPKGATYRVRCGEDFLRREAGEFQPLDLREGPDGALWILDRAGTDPRNPFKLTGKGRVWRVAPLDEWNPPKQTNDLIVAVRAIHDQAELTGDALTLLERAAVDSDPVVRRETATACRALMLGSAAPGIPEPHSVRNTNLLNVVRLCLDASAKDTDAAMEAALWSALEPLFAADTTATLGMFRQLEMPDAPIVCSLFRHGIRRAFSASYEEHLPHLYPLVAELTRQSVPLCLAGVEGIVYGQKTSKRYHRFDKSFRKLLRALTDTQQPELVAGGLQAGALCGYQDSRAEIVKRILDTDLTEAERLQAVQFAQVLRDEPARRALVSLLEKDWRIPNLVLAAAYSLKEIGRNLDVDAVLQAARKQTPEVQMRLAETIAERRDWVTSLTQQVRAGRMDPATLPAPLRHKVQ